MRNLFLFFWKFRFFLFFLLLEGISFFLIVRNNNFQRASFINATLSISTGVQSFVDSFKGYIGLKNENLRLAEENAYLRSLLPSSYLMNAPQMHVSDSLRHQQYAFVPARVISGTFFSRKNYMLLDKGTDSGIKPEMGVITAKGVIGIVKDVSAHYCSVMSFLHKDSRVSARFRKNAYIGSLTWDGHHPLYATLSDIPKHVVCAAGDTIETSSYSSVYPEGIPIGTIEEKSLDKSGNFFIMKVKLLEDFQKLSYVYVVNYLFKDERNKLEEGFVNEQ
jgi:rod shape-determining protein MreC